MSMFASKKREAAVICSNKRSYCSRLLIDASFYHINYHMNARTESLAGVAVATGDEVQQIVKSNTANLVMPVTEHDCKHEA